MDYNQMPLGLGFAFSADRMALNHFTNMSDDEKREYIERNRSILSKKELDNLTASLGEDEDGGSGLDNPMTIFHGPGIG